MSVGFTDTETSALRSLRAKGFAVCVFTPEEMPNSNPSRVEDSMCEGGWHQINFDTHSNEAIST